MTTSIRRCWNGYGIRAGIESEPRTVEVGDSDAAGLSALMVTCRFSWAELGRKTKGSYLSRNCGIGPRGCQQETHFRQFKLSAYKNDILMRKV